MARLNIVVEGHTEETFARVVLSEHLGKLGVLVNQRRVITGRKGAHLYRGGMTSFARAAHDINQWLKEDKSAYVTTMFDLYGLPDDFPGYQTAQKAIYPGDRAEILEKELAKTIDDRRFIPYIQKYEFEAILFSDVAIIDQSLKLVNAGSQLARLQRIRSDFKTPEDINDNPQTAPSKRLKSLYPGYDKEAWGTRISIQIGIDSIRTECPHFNQWLTLLEGLT